LVLVALDVRLHVLRRHQSPLVAKRAQLPRPVVRRRERLQAKQTGRQSTEERQNLRTPKLLAQNRRSLCIDPVHLKNMLRQVQSDRSNLAHGWLPFAADGDHKNALATLGNMTSCFQGRFFAVTALQIPRSAATPT